MPTTDPAPIVGTRGWLTSEGQLAGVITLLVGLLQALPVSHQVQTAALDVGGFVDAVYAVSRAITKVGVARALAAQSGGVADVARSVEAAVVALDPAIPPALVDRLNSLIDTAASELNGLLDQAHAAMPEPAPVVDQQPQVVPEPVVYAGTPSLPAVSIEPAATIVPPVPPAPLPPAPLTADEQATLDALTARQTALASASQLTVPVMSDVTLAQGAPSLVPTTA